MEVRRASEGSRPSHPPSTSGPDFTSRDPTAATLPRCLRREPLVVGRPGRSSNFRERKAALRFSSAERNRFIGVELSSQSIRPRDTRSRSHRPHLPLRFRRGCRGMPAPGIVPGGIMLQDLEKHERNQVIAKSIRMLCDSALHCRGLAKTPGPVPVAGCSLVSWRIGVQMGACGGG